MFQRLLQMFRRRQDGRKDELDEEILNLSTRDINTRRRLLENELRIMKSEFSRLTHEKSTMQEKIKDNVDKIENNRYRPPKVFRYAYPS